MGYGRYQFEDDSDVSSAYTKGQKKCQVPTTEFLLHLILCVIFSLFCYASTDE